MYAVTQFVLGLIENIARHGGGAWLLVLLLSTPIFLAIGTIFPQKVGNAWFAAAGLCLFLIPWPWFPGGPGIFLAIFCYTIGALACLAAHALPQPKGRQWVPKVAIPIILVVGILIRDSGGNNMFG